MSSKIKGEEFLIPVFNGNEYSKWKYRIKLFLESKDLVSILECEKPDTEEEKKKYLEKDLKVRNFLIQALGDDYLDMVMEAKSAKEIITILDGTFDQKSSAMKLLAKRKLLGLKLKENEDPSEFGVKFEKAIMELKSTGEKVSSEDKLNYFLLSLPESKSHLLDVIDALPASDKTVEYVKSKLLTEYSKKNSENSNDESLSSQAFCSKSSRFKKPWINKNLGNPNRNKSESFGQTNVHGKNSVKCFRCGKLGHVQKYCRVGKSFWKNESRNENSRSGCIANVDEGNAFTVEVMSTEKSVKNVNSNANKVKWLLDSACSDHIINSDKHFNKVITLKTPVDVKVGDGYALKASKIGNLCVYFNVNDTYILCEIKNVYFVEKMKQSLLSVSKITDQGNYIITRNDNAKIFNVNDKLIAVAKKIRNLYEITSYVKCDNINANYTSKNMTSKELWHRALGHINFRDLQKLSKENVLEGLPNNISDEFIKCEICIKNKMSNVKFENNRRRAKDILEIIHTDVNGPITPTGINGEKYFVTFIDDYSRLVKVYCIKTKDEVFDRFKEYYELMTNLSGKRVKEIRCDNGGEYLNKNFFKFSKEKGFLLKPAPPYTHELNGVAERFNRSLMNRARCLLEEAKLDKKYWIECVHTSAYLSNRSLANTEEIKSPYEIFFNEKPNVKNLRLFGSTVFVRVPEERRISKLNAKAEKGILVGYTDVGYKVLVKGKIIVSRHVEFIEEGIKVIHLPDESIISEEINEGEKDLSKQKEEEDQGRPKRERKTPSHFKDHIVYVNTTNVLVPNTYEEAIHSEESYEWKKAMEEEYNSLLKNETWELVEKPENKKVISVKWVYKIKADNIYKARLVARGYEQTQDLNENYYAPVARMSTLKLMLSIACHEGWEIEQMDVQTAFLNGQVKGEVYIKQPEGFEEEGNKVCRLKKSLYGLRESPRDWYECFDAFMKSIQFENSKYDNCLYKGKINEKPVYLILYVDDLLICSNYYKSIEMLKNELKGRFEMKDLGKVKSYLGININYDFKQKILRMSQCKYIESVAKLYDVINSKTYETPMEVNLSLELLPICDESLNFRNLIGALLYISAGTRPDIAFSVNYLSRFQSGYDCTHYKYALRILKYLYRTRNVTLNYNGESNEIIDCFVDADWAADSIDRKSTTGIIIRVFNNVIFWKTQKQKIVSRASTHAEFYALANAVEEILYHVGLVKEFNVVMTNPVKIYEDNSSAILLAKQGTFSKNSKHIDVSYHFVNEHLKNNVINIVKVDTENNLADVLTKALGRVKFSKFKQLLGLL